MHIQSLEQRQLCESYELLVERFTAAERPADLITAVHDMWSLAVMPGEPRILLFRSFRPETLRKLTTMLNDCDFIQKEAMRNNSDKSFLRHKLLVLLSNFFSSNQQTEASNLLVDTLLIIAVGSEQIGSHKAWVCLGNISSQQTARQRLLGDQEILKALGSYDVAAHSDEVLYVLAALSDNLCLEYCREFLPLVRILNTLYFSQQKTQRDILFILAELAKFKDVEYVRELYGYMSEFFKQLLEQINSGLVISETYPALCTFFK